MAKALLGHVGSNDPRVISEVRRLQQRVRELEAELLHLQAENQSLRTVAGRTDELLTLEVKEPAMA